MKIRDDNEDFVEDSEQATKVRRLDRFLGIALSPFALGWLVTSRSESLHHLSTIFFYGGIVVLALGLGALTWLNRAKLKSEIKDFVERL